MSAAKQLVLDLPVRQALGRADFFVAPCNAMAVTQLDAWQQWPQGRLALVGPSGSGKTHLSHVWAGMTGAKIVKAVNLQLSDSSGALVVEDVESIDGNEEALFHVYNALHATGYPLLITGQSAPSRWELSLADLRSRLESVPVVQLESPDDDLLSMIMVKLFDDRQLPVSPKLIRFLVARVGRSYEAVHQMVAELDKAALAARKPLTVHLASKFLKEQAND